MMPAIAEPHHGDMLPLMVYESELLEPRALSFARAQVKTRNSVTKGTTSGSSPDTMSSSSDKMAERRGGSTFAFTDVDFAAGHTRGHLRRETSKEIVSCSGGKSS